MAGLTGTLDLRVGGADVSGSNPVPVVYIGGATQTTMAAVLTELGQKLEPADISALATAANQTTQSTALANLMTELMQKLEPSDLAPLATAAHQAVTEGKLDTLVTTLGTLVKPSDLAALSTAANQVSANTKLDAIVTALGPKLSASDIAGLATAAKQDAAKAVLDSLHTDLSNIGGYVDGLEALAGTGNTTAASILAKLSADPATQTTLAAVLAKLGGTLLVESSTPLQTAFTYFGATGDARAGLLQTITEQRASDSKTRTITLTRDTASGSITTQSATAWT